MTFFFLNQFYVLIDGPFVCMCVYRPFMPMCLHVCVAHCVMRCLDDKHKASLRGILIRSFATVVMETALSICISQWW